MSETVQTTREAFADFVQRVEAECAAREESAFRAGRDSFRHGADETDDEAYAAWSADRAGRREGEPDAGK